MFIPNREKRIYCIYLKVVNQQRRRSGAMRASQQNTATLAYWGNLVEHWIHIRGHMTPCSNATGSILQFYLFMSSKTYSLSSGNLLAVVALRQSAKLRQNPSTAFMVNLPACLLPVCAVGMPLFGIGCLQVIYCYKVLYPEWFSVTLFTIALILSQVHLHTICALAFNR